MTSWVIGTLDTGKWDFVCLATSREHAIELMAKAWQLHSEQTGADPDNFNEDDMWFTEIEPGEVFRDETLLVTRPKLTAAAAEAATKEDERREQAEEDGLLWLSEQLTARDIASEVLGLGGNCLGVVVPLDDDEQLVIARQEREDGHDGVPPADWRWVSQRDLPDGSAMDLTDDATIDELVAYVLAHRVARQRLRASSSDEGDRNPQR